MTVLSKCEPHVDTVSLHKLACQLLSQEPRWISQSPDVIIQSSTFLFHSQFLCYCFIIIILKEMYKMLNIYQYKSDLCSLFLYVYFVFVFQSQKLHVQTTGGKVICLGTIYGNIDIHALDKSVRLKFSFLVATVLSQVGSHRGQILQNFWYNFPFLIHFSLLVNLSLKQR